MHGVDVCIGSVQSKGEEEEEGEEEDGEEGEEK